MSKYIPQEETYYYRKREYSYEPQVENNKLHFEKNKKIGPFILGEKLGKGTFGVVRLGTHIITREKVAVKILEKSKILEKDDQLRVEREIKILKYVHHDNIVQLYNVKQTNSSIYLIMEYCSGKELFDYIVKKRRLPEYEAANFYIQILSGIQYLSEVRIVHRDLKPENLLLDANKKKLKIADFGLSNIYKRGELLKTACGSPCYAAPEMINGEHYNGVMTDIWSSGIVLFAMVCGYLPFEDKNNDLLYQKITSGSFSIPSHVSENGRNLIKGILNVNPNRRLKIPDILAHPWFSQFGLNNIQLTPGILTNVLIIPIDEDIVEKMAKLNFPKEETRVNVLANRHNDITSVYYLLLKQKIYMGESSVSDLNSEEFREYYRNPKNLLKNYQNIQDVIKIRSQGEDTNLYENAEEKMKNHQKFKNLLNSSYKRKHLIKKSEQNKSDVFTSGEISKNKSGIGKTSVEVRDVNRKKIGNDIGINNIVANKIPFDNYINVNREVQGRNLNTKKFLKIKAQNINLFTNSNIGNETNNSEFSELRNKLNFQANLNRTQEVNEDKYNNFHKNKNHHTLDFVDSIHKRNDEMGISKISNINDFSHTISSTKPEESINDRKNNTNIINIFVTNNDNPSFNQIINTTREKKTSDLTDICLNKMNKNTLLSSITENNSKKDIKKQDKESDLLLPKTIVQRHYTVNTNQYCNNAKKIKYNTNLIKEDDLFNSLIANNLTDGINDSVNNTNFSRANYYNDDKIKNKTLDSKPVDKIKKINNIPHFDDFHKIIQQSWKGDSNKNNVSDNYINLLMNKTNPDTEYNNDITQINNSISISNTYRANRTINFENNRNNNQIMKISEDKDSIDNIDNLTNNNTNYDISRDCNIDYEKKDIINKEKRNYTNVNKKQIKKIKIKKINNKLAYLDPLKINNNNIITKIMGSNIRKYLNTSNENNEKTNTKINDNYRNYNNYTNNTYNFNISNYNNKNPVKKKPKFCTISLKEKQIFNTIGVSTNDRNNRNNKNIIINSVNTSSNKVNYSEKNQSLKVMNYQDNYNLKIHKDQNYLPKTANNNIFKKISKIKLNKPKPLDASYNNNGSNTNRNNNYKINNRNFIINDNNSNKQMNNTVTNTTQSHNFSHYKNSNSSAINTTNNNITYSSTTSNNGMKHLKKISGLNYAYKLNNITLDSNNNITYLNIPYTLREKDISNKNDNKKLFKNSINKEKDKYGQKEILTERERDNNIENIISSKIGPIDASTLTFKSENKIKENLIKYFLLSQISHSISYVNGTKFICEKDKIKFEIKLNKVKEINKLTAVKIRKISGNMLDFKKLINNLIKNLFN